MASPVPACCLSQYYHFSQFSGIGVVGSWYVKVGKQYKVLWNLSLCLVYVKSTEMEGTFWWMRIVRGQRCGGGEGIAALCQCLPHYYSLLSVRLESHFRLHHSNNSGPNKTPNSWTVKLSGQHNI